MKALSTTLLLLNIAYLLNAQVVGLTTNTIHLDFKGEELNTSLPVIEWEYPAMENSAITENAVTLRAYVNSPVDLKAVYIQIRQDVEEQPMKKDLKLSESKRFRLEQSVRLFDGENIVELVAETAEGARVMEKRTILVGMTDLAKRVSADRKDYALLFATNKYEHWNDLVNPINDVQAIAKELEEKYGFEVQIVTDATKEDITLEIRKYSTRQFNPQDQLFVFFAGHGQYDETLGMGYIAATNTLLKDDSRSSYLSFADLRTYIDNIRCEHIFVSLDVCFGGTFDQVLASNRAMADDIENMEMIARKMAVKTRKYLTSGSKQYVGDGIPGSHSPFASRFITALRSYGSADRILTLMELNTYMDKLPSTPRFGGFGSDENGSDFLFIAR
ncbi:MAG: caspase family protein [Cyclobacteriaceae bacterium]|nr:caspase family protein [Cyclobacteriaceae bacterium]